MKKMVLLGAVSGFLFCIIATYQWPDSAYYLLHTRAWEMLVGGIAYLYPIKFKDDRKKLVELFGLGLIVGSYFLITRDDFWPGYLAIFPVMGAYLTIQANRHDGFISKSKVIQKVGSWSYSMYLWHWPIVVAIYYFSLNEYYIYLGILLTIFLGFMSYKYIESLRFGNTFSGLTGYMRCKPISMALVVGMAGVVVFVDDGFIRFSSTEYQNLMSNAKPSPYREKCHIKEYQAPTLSCEYFGSKISWAVLGDSHSTEIAFALASKLKGSDDGLKHFTFSACKPSFGEDQYYSKCSKWYNESIDFIVHNEDIKNVVLNHRFTESLFGSDAANYPVIEQYLVTDEVIKEVKRIDDLIVALAASKENVYVFYPVPELPGDIDELIDLSYGKGESLDNVAGTTLVWYQERNKYFINHLNNVDYPDNVKLLNTRDVFCDEKECYAVKNGVPLYFDDNHPSVLGATKLVELIK